MLIGVEDVASILKYPTGDPSDQPWLVRAVEQGDQGGE